MSRKIEELDAQIAQLKARKQKLVARESAEARRIRTRQAAILGAWLMANDQAQVERIKAALVRPQDRAAFGLQADDSSADTSPAGA